MQVRQVPSAIEAHPRQLLGRDMRVSRQKRRNLNQAATTDNGIHEPAEKRGAEHESQSGEAAAYRDCGQDPTPTIWRNGGWPPRGTPPGRSPAASNQCSMRLNDID
jgi:hypothetical protein